MSPRDVVEAIKRLSPPPAALVVGLVDGTEKKLAVPKAGNRWSKLESVVTGLPPWERIDAVDGDGNIVGTVLDGDEDVEVEGDEEGVTGEERTMRMFARLLADSQRSTMREAARMFDSATKHHASAFDAMVRAMEVSARSYENALRVQAANAVAGAGAGGEGDEEFNTMLKLGMMSMLNQGRPAMPMRPPIPAAVPPGDKGSK